MKALILAGGRGTRLRPLTVYTPKPVVPLVNRPFLLYQIEVLQKAEITDITLSVGYQPDKIEHILGNGSEYGVEIHYVTEPSPLGTAGAYKFAADPSSSTIVLNGDILTDVNISDVVAFHNKKKASATIVLARVDNPSAYGLVETAEDGKVLRFMEKPKPEECVAEKLNTINAGIYILEPDVLELIPTGENSSFEYNVFPALLEAKKPFYSYILEKNYWRDIGTTESYLEAHLDFLGGKINGFDIGKTGKSDIATAASVDKRSILGGECTVKPGARIINSVIGAGVNIEEKAIVENSIIWPHTRIAAAAVLKNAVVGRGCYIGRNSSIRPGTVLGDKASIPDYSRA
jgi:NDP-sugar pyrophosphorylase family protein